MISPATLQSRVIGSVRALFPEGNRRPPPWAMSDLIKLVRTYRLTAGLAERLRLAEEIFRVIEPDLRVFVFSSVSPDAAKDALQEVLKAVATSLKQFTGG